MAIEVHPRTGNIIWRFPDLELDQIPADRSCALDIADEGPLTLEDVGDLFNVTRERMRQMETLALTSFLARLSPSEREEFREALRDSLNRPSRTSPLGEIREDSGEGEGFKSVQRRSDCMGLPQVDEWDADRWSNEILCLLREGRSLEDAQALVNGHEVGGYSLPEVVGPEQRPKSLLGAAVVREEDIEMGCVGIQSVTRERREVVLGLLRESGPMTTRAVSEETGMDLGNGTATLFMQAMERDGLVRSFRQGRGAITWHLEGSGPGEPLSPVPETKDAPGVSQGPGRAAPEESPPEAPDPPPPTLAKVVRNETYGTDVDPVEILRSRMAVLQAERDAKVRGIHDEYAGRLRKLADALAALE